MNQHIRAGAIPQSPSVCQKQTEYSNTTVLTYSTLDGITIASMHGILNSRNAGRVYDALVQCAIEGKASLIVDLSGVTHATRAGVRGLIVAAKLMKPGRGRMRICGANGQVALVLRGTGFDHLLKIDPTLEMSMETLSPSRARTPLPTYSGAPNSGYVDFLEMVSHRRKAV